ncbi:MAG: CopG family transcriptional regulator [Candidatus Dormibacteria bacterium]
MRRLQIYVDEAVDEVLGREASRRGLSKAAIVREALAKELDGALPQPGEDPWGGLIGLFSDGGVDDIDSVLYAPIEHA